MAQQDLLKSIIRRFNTVLRIIRIIQIVYQRLSNRRGGLRDRRRIRKVVQEQHRELSWQR